MVNYFSLKGVQLFFTNGDFQANELGTGGSVSLMPVRVAKNVRIASRIELVVVPLTVQDAMGTSLPLPPNVPNDDTRSPPFASKIIKCLRFIAHVDVIVILSRFE